MRHHWQGLLTARTAPWWMLAALLSALTGFALTLWVGELPGSEGLSVEDGVDVVGYLALGLIGSALLRQGVAGQLGQSLVALAALVGMRYLMGGLADALADAQEPPVAAQLLSIGSEAIFIAAFALLILAPLLLFPTGQLPSSRWRWTGWVAFAAVGISMLAVLLAPGPVDEDVPAWGDNPIGISALDGASDVMAVLGLVLMGAALGGGLAAFVARWVRYRGDRRREMVWLTLGVTPLIVGVFIDWGTVAEAIVIFGGLIAGIGWPLLGTPGRAAEKVRASSTAPELSP